MFEYTEIIYIYCDIKEKEDDSRTSYAEQHQFTQVTGDGQDFFFYNF